MNPGRYAELGFVYGVFGRTAFQPFSPERMPLETAYGEILTGLCNQERDVREQEVMSEVAGCWYQPLFFGGC